MLAHTILPTIAIIIAAASNVHAASFMKRDFLAKDITLTPVPPANAACKGDGEKGNRACGADGHGIWNCKGADGWVLVDGTESGCLKKCCNPDTAASTCTADVLSWQSANYCTVPPPSA